MVRKRILLANDPELLRTLKDSFFGRSGFALIVAESEQQAFELIEEQDPGLAIFNLEQPGLRGDICSRNVKSDPILRGTPIILVVPPGAEKDLTRCREAGCDRILYKPIDPDELMNAACQLLNIVKRGAPRVDVSLPLRCGSDLRNLRPGRILNLNIGGAFISTDKLFPVNTIFTTEFSFSGSDHTLCCKGRVAWVNHPEWIKTTKLPAGMGVQFLDLAPEDAEALRNFLDLSFAKNRDDSRPRDGSALLEDKERILDFWFDELSGAEGIPPERLRLWFGGREETDSEVRDRFGADLQKALQGEYDHWSLNPRGALALIILLDQFPRHIYRNTSRAYACDHRALDLCRTGMAQGQDRSLSIIERAFFYLPLEHAEDARMQELSVRAFEELLAESPEGTKEVCESFLDYAVRHRKIIERFGRFPHRNAALSRRSTAEEEAFLKEPGSSF